MTKPRAARAVVLLLARAESQIALIDSAQPLEFDREYARLQACWSRGNEHAPDLHYASRRSPDALKRELERIAGQCHHQYAESEWLIGRARELLLEARMVDVVGTPEFARLASIRFAPSSAEASLELEALARKWVAEGASAIDDELCFRSDDRRATQSLWSVLAKRIDGLRLPVSLRVDPGLVPLAACGQDFVVIRANTWLSARVAARITEHEVVGHLLPRLAARGRLDVLRCGCAGATDDEEGRALLIESRVGLMDRERRAELGARHLACVYLRRGATFVEMVRQLVGQGAPLDLALGSAMRASRGGGLGREIVYLSAMWRLERAFDAQPAVERWFDCGRASLDYAIARHELTTTARACELETAAV